MWQNKVYAVASFKTMIKIPSIYASEWGKVFASGLRRKCIVSGKIKWMASTLNCVFRLSNYDYTAWVSKSSDQKENDRKMNREFHTNAQFVYSFVSDWFKWRGGKRASPFHKIQRSHEILFGHHNGVATTATKEIFRNFSSDAIKVCLIMVSIAVAICHYYHKRSSCLWDICIRNSQRPRVACIDCNKI